MTSALGEFLQARRARARPGDVGVADYGDARRVPGLRREELAALAGVSAPYYARLEQGTARNASPQVLDAIAAALRLDDGERAHLRRLAASTGVRDAAGRPPAQVAEPLAQLLAAFDGPAVVLTDDLDVLDWNAAGHALTAGHLADTARPNTAVSAFCDPATRALYPDLERKLRAVVGHLRMTAGRRPGDPRTAELVARLTARSDEFARLWADHTVGPCTGGSYLLAHPAVGPVRVYQQTLSPLVGDRDEAGQCLVTFTAEPGSSAAAALRRLVPSRLVERPT